MKTGLAVAGPVKEVFRAYRLPASFTERLKDLIESGYGLCKSEAESVGSLPG